MKKMTKIGFAALAIAVTGSVFAQDDEYDGAIGWTPIAIGIASPIQIPWGLARWDVFGLDFNLLYSDAPKIYGLGVGGAALTTRDTLAGLGTSAFCNWADADVYGIRLTLGANIAMDNEVDGIEAGAFGYRKDFWGLDANFLGSLQQNMNGVQFAGLVNLVNEQSYGLDVALGVNMANTAYGCQVGGCNMTEELHGAQIGLVNYAKECPWGFQIGLVNIIMDNAVKVLPVVNGYF